MIEFKNKHDYSVSVFDANGFLARHSFVDNVFKQALFYTNHADFKEWTAINVYARRSGRFIRQYKKGEFIDQKPR